MIAPCYASHLPQAMTGKNRIVLWQEDDEVETRFTLMPTGIEAAIN